MTKNLQNVRKDILNVTNIKTHPKSLCVRRDPKLTAVGMKVVPTGLHCCLFQSISRQLRKEPEGRCDPELPAGLHTE